MNQRPMIVCMSSRYRRATSYVDATHGYPPTALVIKHIFKCVLQFGGMPLCATLYNGSSGGSADNVIVRGSTDDNAMKMTMKPSI